MDKEIYHYDQNDYFYVGSQIIYGDEGGRFSIPHAATDIAPPVRNQWPDGHVPVFQPNKAIWVFEKNEFWQVDLEERCFYTGRNSEGPVYLAADPSSQNYQHELMMYSTKFPVFSIPRLGASPNMIHLGQRIDFININIKQLEIYWMQMKTNVSLPLFGQGASLYHFLAESLVGAIRRFLDDLTTVVFLKRFQSYEPWKRDIVINGYSDLFGEYPEKRVNKLFQSGERGADTDKLCDQFIRTILGSNREFLKTIQGLNNSYKHSVTANAVRYLHGKDFPTILTVGVAGILPPYNLGRLVYHNHGLRQIVLGLRDYLDDLVMRLAGLEANTRFLEKCAAHQIKRIKSTLNGPAGV